MNKVYVIMNDRKVLYKVWDDDKYFRILERLGQIFPEYQNE